MATINELYQYFREKRRKAQRDFQALDKTNKGAWQMRYQLRGEIDALTNVLFQIKESGLLNEQKHNIE